MAFSIQRAVSDGTMTLLPISIEYLDREEISVLFDGVLNARQWAWVGTTDKTLSFTPAVDNAVEVVIVRTTDLSQLRHQFSLGAQFTAESLDESLVQVLHIAQEAAEQLQGTDFYNDLDLHGYKIANVAPGVNPGDAVNKGQMEVHDATIVGYMNTTKGYKDSASASAAAALVSELNAASEVADHVALADPHTQYLKEADIDLANLAKVNAAQNFTLPQRSALLTDNGGSFNLSAKQNFKCTTAGAVTLTFTSQANGLSGSIIFVNSSNHTVSAHANTKLTAADLSKLSATGTYRIDYLSDGTNAYCSVVGAYS